MAKFRFRLEPLLDARRRAEERKLRAVADIERQRLALELELRECQDRILSVKRDLSERLVGRIDMGGLRMQAGFSLHRIRLAQQLAIRLAGVHQRLSAARAALLEATKRRRALELLRDRRFEEWRREQERRESAEIDELAVSVAARKEL